MAKFIESDPCQPMLLPVDLREWAPSDDLSHFVLAAVERVSLDRFRINERGSGSAQYHPKMMLALLIYCYANGVFGSRKIERATYRDLGVRYITADRHPDHDTICKFRRENFEAVADNGYASQAQVEALEQPDAAGRRMEALASVGAEGRRRRYDFRPPKPPQGPVPKRSPRAEAMRTKLDSESGRAKYRLRQQTVEPVFGIIKNVLGFRQFTLRGHEKVQGEWQWVNLAYNCKRLHRLARALPG